MKRSLGVVAVVASLLIAGSVALAASSPSVSTGSATSVKQMTAVLNGTVNPNGAGTTYFFQWGLDRNYGANSRPHSAGSGTKPVSLHATATGLIPGTVYHYRLVAISRFGETGGADRTFKTTGPPPAVVATGPASQIGTNFATVTGIINPNGARTTWYFQYGLSTSYQFSTAPATVPTGGSPVTVAFTLQGLEFGTIFHYRLVAVHGSAVTTSGNDEIFMTYPSPRPQPVVHALTRPRAAKGKPYSFTTTGSVTGPSSIPQPFACTGFVAIRYFLHGRSIALVLAPVEPSCTFAGQAVFNRLPGRGPRHRSVTLRVHVYYRGNGYLTGKFARHAQQVTLAG